MALVRVLAQLVLDLVAGLLACFVAFVLREQIFPLRPTHLSSYFDVFAAIILAYLACFFVARLYSDPLEQSYRRVCASIASSTVVLMAVFFLMSAAEVVPWRFAHQISRNTILLALLLVPAFTALERWLASARGSLLRGTYTHA